MARLSICLVVGLISGLAALVAQAAPSSASALLPPGFVETTVAKFDSNALPDAIAIIPDGRILVAQKYGVLRMIKNDTLLSTPVITVPVSGSNERGLIGIAIDPNFAANHYFYLFYSATTPNFHNRISRFTMVGDTASLASEFVLTDLDPVTTSFHNAGDMHFGADGKLYVSVGNDGVAENSPLLTNRLGKILRLNSDGTIPTDNPFYNTASGLNRQIWAYGLRNPDRFAIQPGTNNLLINDVGEDHWEEIDQGIAGANYGWPTCEAACNPAQPGLTDPVYQQFHGDGDNYARAFIGSAFYNPANPTFPSQYIGKYFFEDYVNGWIHVFDPATKTVQSFMQGVPALVDMAVSDDGAIYYVQINDAANTGAGTVRKIQYTGQHNITIGEQPASQTAAGGTTATFEVRASGDATITYQWQRNGVDIPGATSSVYTTPVLSAASDDGSTYDAVLTNPVGTVTSAVARLTVTPNEAPTGTITAPANGTHYNAGDTFTYSGTATDPEDGNLPASAFTWRIDLHHNDHWHPGIIPAFSGQKSGSFTIPTGGETSANVFYRISLIVTDSAGAESTSFVDIVPNTSVMTFRTNPPGLQTMIDGQPMADGTTVQGVVNMPRMISAPAQGGYDFQSWSDGGSATHSITTPATDTTFTANFKQQMAAGYTSTPPTTWTAGQTQTVPITVTNNGTLTWNAAGTNPYDLGVSFGGASDNPGNNWATDQRIPLPNDVAPGQSVTINAAITPPTNLGGFTLRFRMVREGIAWFQQMQKTSVTVVGGPLAASYASTPPTTWTAGQTQSYPITLTNAGTQTWLAGGSNPMRLGVSFGTASDLPNQGWISDQRFNLPNDVAPGQSVTITVGVTPPATSAGSYVLRNRMVQEGVAWFPQLQKTNVNINGLPPRAATYSSTPPTSWFAGQTQTYPVTVTNTGGTVWNAGGTNPVDLGVSFGGASDNPGAGWVTDQRFSLPSDVAPGQSVTVNVAVTAPLAGGSFVLRHRLVKEGVAWFPQQQKTNVSVPYWAASYSSTPPTTWFVGQSQTFPVTVTNLGGATWPAGGTNPVRLGVSFGGTNDSPGSGWLTDQRFVLPADVAPGQSVTMNATVTPPATAGTFTLRNRMVHEGVAWFDQMQKTTVTVPARAAAYSATPPTSWTPGQTQAVSVTLTNLGGTAWNANGVNPVRLGASFGGASDSPQDGWVTDQRFSLPNDVAPGASVTFTVNITAPAAAGSYTLRLRMVKENVAWFPQMLKTPVSVGAAAGVTSSPMAKLV